MKIRLLKLHTTGRYIFAIKAVRSIAGLGLKQAKDIVDEVKAGRPQTIQVNDDRFVDDLRVDFIYEKIDDGGDGKNLKLWRVITPSGAGFLVLASTEEIALECTAESAVRATEVKGPFRDGGILAAFVVPFTKGD
jgi:hypothetical protein